MSYQEKLLKTKRVIDSLKKLESQGMFYSERGNLLRLVKKALMRQLKEDDRQEMEKYQSETKGPIPQTRSIFVMMISLFTSSKIK